MTKPFPSIGIYSSRTFPTQLFLLIDYPSSLGPACKVNATSMGLLYLGTPLAWDDAKKFADHVRNHGINQFLHIWDRLKDRQGDELLWGDEVHSLR